MDSRPLCEQDSYPFPSLPNSPSLCGHPTLHGDGEDDDNDDDDFVCLLSVTHPF